MKVRPLQAGDLRIGNFIISGNNGTFDTDYLDYGKVLSIGQEDQEFEQIYCECEESFNWYFRDNYFGIPLTKEWLVEFGYKKVNDLSNGATAWERRKRGQN